MTVMTSREFNQHTSLAQKYAQTAPVIITNRGKPAYVLIKYEDYQVPSSRPSKSIAEALADISPDCADIDLPLPPRSRAQRRAVDFGDE